MKDLIYLAAPYTATEHIQQWRYDQLIKVCTALIHDDYAIICPVVHCHPIYLEGAARGLKPDFAFWKDYNKAVLWACDAFMVCTLPEWEASIGVQQELKWARGLDMKIRLVNWSTFKITDYAMH